MRLRGVVVVVVSAFALAQLACGSDDAFAPGTAVDLVGMRNANYNQHGHVLAHVTSTKYVVALDSGPKLTVSLDNMVVPGSVPSNPPSLVLADAGVASEAAAPDQAAPEPAPEATEKAVPVEREAPQEEQVVAEQEGVEKQAVVAEHQAVEKQPEAQPQPAEQPVTAQEPVDSAESGPEPHLAPSSNNDNNDDNNERPILSSPNEDQELVHQRQVHEALQKEADRLAMKAKEQVRVEAEKVKEQIALRTRQSSPALSTPEASSQELAPGTRVKLQGLQKTELNGKTATVVGSVGDSGRVEVELDEQKRHISVKPDNLDANIVPENIVEQDRLLPLDEELDKYSNAELARMIRGIVQEEATERRRREERLQAFVSRTASLKPGQHVLLQSTGDSKLEGRDGVVVDKLVGEQQVVVRLEGKGPDVRVGADQLVEAPEQTPVRMQPARSFAIGTQAALIPQGVGAVAVDAPRTSIPHKSVLPKNPLGSVLQSVGAMFQPGPRQPEQVPVVGDHVDVGRLGVGGVVTALHDSRADVTLEDGREKTLPVRDVRVTQQQQEIQEAPAK